MGDAFTAVQAAGDSGVDLALYIPLGVGVLALVGIIAGALFLRPATYTETWKENRDLRGEMRDLRKEANDLRDDVDALKSAAEMTDRKRNKERTIYLVALEAYERFIATLLEAWGSPAAPEPPLSMRQATEALKDLRRDTGPLDVVPTV